MRADEQVWLALEELVMLSLHEGEGYEPMDGPYHTGLQSWAVGACDALVAGGKWEYTPEGGPGDGHPKWREIRRKY